MVEVITHENPQAAIGNNYPLWNILGSGAALGVLFWGLNAWMSYYVVDQILCRSNSTLAACSNSSALATGIATVVVAIIGTGLMVRLRIFQPLVVAIAAGLVLFELGVWTSGLSWGEALLWSILLYVLSYLLFTWIARYRRVIVVLLVTTLIVGVIKILLTN